MDKAIKEVKDVRLSQDKKYQWLQDLELFYQKKYKEIKKEREDYYKNN